MIWRFFTLAKAIVLAALATYLTISACQVMLRAQPPNVYQLNEKINSLQMSNEKRLAVLETVSQQLLVEQATTNANIWKLLLGVAALVGETVWTYVLKARNGSTT